MFQAQIKGTMHLVKISKWRRSLYLVPTKLRRLGVMSRRIGTLVLMLHKLRGHRARRPRRGLNRFGCKSQ
jgi:hypothetical protein